VAVIGLPASAGASGTSPVTPRATADAAVGRLRTGKRVAPGVTLEGVSVVVHTDPGEFARLARPLLDADPVRHTIALTALDAMCRGAVAPEVLLSVHENGGLAGVVLRTAGWPLILSALPVRHAAAVAAAVPGAEAANGPVPEVEAFAAARTARTGASVHVAMRERLFRLDTLTPPDRVPGVARSRAGPRPARRLEHRVRARGGVGPAAPGGPPAAPA
jgi:hypothetical protein